jgi:hypothetical protein
LTSPQRVIAWRRNSRCHVVRDVAFVRTMTDFNLKSVSTQAKKSAAAASVGALPTLRCGLNSNNNKPLTKQGGSV